MQKPPKITAEDLYIQQAKDAMHVLPLEMVSLMTPGLKRTFLVKNARLETQVQLFQGQGSGSGVTSMDKLAGFFPSHKAELEADRPKLDALSSLASFDVFSLRIGLRRLGISVNDSSYLSLSPHIQKNLAVYMQELTKPLLVKIYGPHEQNIDNFSDLVALFKNPDKKEALKNLRQMSAALGIGLAEIPLFLEDYGDIFLSVAYYRSNFEKVRVSVIDFIIWAEGIKENSYLAGNKRLMASCKMADENLTDACNKIANSLDIFQDRFSTFWEDINVQSFQKIKTMVTSNYEFLGGILCGLSVKMGGWEERFPNRTGAPNIRADFIMAEIVPGLNRINSLLSNVRG